MSKRDYCRLCGKYVEMTFEHIPPRSAFNDQQRLFKTIEDLIGSSNRKYSRFRRGLGKHSLCIDCNRKTGGWYGKAFVSWTRQGMNWLEKLGQEPHVDLPFNIYPLNVVKQVLVMAIAMSSHQTMSYHYDLRRFLLNPEQKYLPTKYSVFTYFNRDGTPRFASDMVVTNVKKGAGSYVETEVALPPFGYCVSKPVKAMKSLAVEQGLYDITWFAEFDYNFWTTIYLRAPLKETHQAFPLDYRTKDEVEDAE